MKLARTNNGHQLLVEGKPFLILGGELGNSTASSIASIESTWPRLKGLNLNTVLAPVYWEQCEPSEGEFDFTLVDALIDGARANQLRLVLLWFGAWKNSMSSYAPAWVKRDAARFPRAITHDGRAVEILSPFAAANMEADARAFAAFMKHLRKVDADRQTVLMVQVENEIGLLPDARDHSASANAAKSWDGTFDGTAAADERFTAWGFARFVNELARRGKAEYALPMYVNAALNRPGRAPGEYPSGGPIPHLIDIWRAVAPDVDMLSPDIYFFDVPHWIEPYRRADNALFVPEAMRSARASSNAMNVIARGSIGFCPFSIEDTTGREAQLLSQTYSALRHLSPHILDAQARGSEKLIGLAPKMSDDGSLDDSPQTVSFDGYTLTVRFAGGARPPAPLAELTSDDPAMRGKDLPPAGGMIIVTGPGDYTIVGIGMTITHACTSNEQAGLLSVEELSEHPDGAWLPSRWLNGDQTNQGRNVFLPADSVGMLRVRLYRYR